MSILTRTQILTKINDYLVPKVRVVNHKELEIDIVDSCYNKESDTVVNTVVAGTNVSVNNTDPLNPKVSVVDDPVFNGPISAENLSGTNTGDQDLSGYMPTNLTREPTGFLDPENVIVSYNSITRKITLTGTTTAYYRGVLVSDLISGWESTAHDDIIGVYFLYFNGTSFVWGTSSPDFSVLQIAIINYRAINSFGNRECHGFMPWQCHQKDHMTTGTYRSSGGDISNLVLLSTTSDNRRPIISDCIIWDEDLPTTNAQLTSKKYSQRFMSGASDIGYTLQANDIVPLSGNNPYYNSFSSPNYGQTLMPANSMMTVWLYEIPTTADSGSQEIRHVFVQGQSVSVAANSSTSALTTAYNLELAKQTTELNLGVPAIVAAEFVAIHKFIIQYTGGNWTIRGSIKLTGTRNNQTSAPSGNYLSLVSHDNTLTGSGTPLDPLSVIQVVNKIQTLTDASSIDWNMDNGSVGIITLGATGRTMNAPTNIIAGGYYKLLIKQDATGSRTITTWNSVFKFPGAAKPVLTATANATDIVEFFAESSSILHCINFVSDVK